MWFKINPNIDTQRGFTLVELIVSIVVAGILISATSVAITNNSKLAQRGRDVTAANSYAENKIEALRSAGYLAVPLGVTNVTNELPDELKNPRSGEIEVTQDSISNKKIELAITYNDQGQPRTYVYTTLIGELGVGQY
jgi:prepilin-type N-terminal cleavage/methylation domain-containing protein